MTDEQIQFALDLAGIPYEPCFAGEDDSLLFGFEIANFEFINAKYPNDFGCTQQDKEHIEIGMWVKIKADWIIVEDVIESFWGKIIEEYTDEKGNRLFYCEALNNTCMVKRGMRMGPIRLRNIYDINFEEFYNRKKI